MARRAQADPEFKKKAKELYAHALENVELVMLDGVETASQMLTSGPKTVEGIAEMMEVHSLRSFQDPRPNYFAQIVNAHRSLLAKQKMALDNDPDNLPKVDLVIELTDGGASEDPTSTEPAAEQSVSTDQAEADGLPELGARRR